MEKWVKQNMGKVLTVMRVFPQEEQDLDVLIESLKKLKGFNTAKIVDYVFGSKIIQASFVCEDGANMDFEEMVKAVPGVSEVNVDEVGLI
mgnify:CR=1 FL=1